MFIIICRDVYRICVLEELRVQADLYLKGLLINDTVVLVTLFTYYFGVKDDDSGGTFIE